MKRTFSAIFILCLLTMQVFATTTYTLAPGDTLEVKILGQEKLDTKQTIAPDGSVSLPVIGRTLAAGSTLQSFQSRIQKSLARFFAQTNIVVFLTPRPVYVVENDGDSRKVTALSEGEATALASGMNESAKVSRKGDVILIEKPKPIYVVLHNLKTNTFETKTAQTVSEAIALAGGGVVATMSDEPVTTANVHPGDILTVNIGKAPDFWEENWSKIISATAVIVGIVTTLHH